MEGEEKSIPIKFSIEKIREAIQIDKENRIVTMHDEKYLLRDHLENVLEYLERLDEENENAKWYVHQMIVRLSESIEDFIDDDREGNKDIIGELKETRKQWKDVENLLNGEIKVNLYNDWRKYGEYE